ncbi:MAG TPA: PilZ domain-containing protein [Pyrinomonadaceae bacterium]|nr:PilZ domain-containing protein [Pyrinomonadaceae bacterium]
MKFEGKSKRLRERLELSLPVRVMCRESLDHEWVEMSRLIDVTPFGARFTIHRPTETGRLLHLTLPMPRQLRCFDHVEDQYRVWTLVRNVKTVEQGADKPPRYEVGVAFIGKRPPPSFEANPTQRYDVASSPTESGLWNLHELPDRAATHTIVDEPRPETRHQIPIEVLVEVFNENGELSASETTVTENISRRGAAVFTTLDVARGRFVRLTSTHYQISVIAAVRARRTGADSITRLHLEFVDRQWPLEGIE